MGAPRKLLLLDPSKKLLSDFRKKTEQVINESQALLEAVPKLPTEEVDVEYINGAESLLECMVDIQEQLKSLQATYKNMKRYIEEVCIQSQRGSIETINAIGVLSSRTHFDQKIFKESNPDLYQQYIKQTAPFLVVKRRK